MGFYGEDGLHAIFSFKLIYKDWVGGDDDEEEERYCDVGDGDDEGVGGNEDVGEGEDVGDDEASRMLMMNTLGMIKCVANGP